MTRPRLLALFLIALLLAAAGGAVVTADPAPSHASGSAASATPGPEVPRSRVPEHAPPFSNPPPGVNPALWRPAVNPPDAPPPSIAARPDLVPENLASGGAAACYPQGHIAYQPECVNPGYTLGSARALHWEKKPGQVDDYRYVWVLDSLSQTRDSEWLTYNVNLLNNLYAANPGTGKRLIILLHTAEQLGLTPGPCHLSAAAHSHWIDVCEKDVQPSVADWWYNPAVDHFTFCRARIFRGAGGINDMFLGQSVLHEVGHCIGFAHDTDPQSPMTYDESTVGKQYFLDYGLNQYTVYAGLYDGPHYHGAPVDETETVAGSTFYMDGTSAKSGPTGTQVAVFASGAEQGFSYTLASGKGTAAAPCSSDVVTINATVRYANANGVIGQTAGPLNRPVGTWQVCFIAPGQVVTAPVTFTVV